MASPTTPGAGSSSSRRIRAMSVTSSRRSPATALARTPGTGWSSSGHSRTASARVPHSASPMGAPGAIAGSRGSAHRSRYQGSGSLPCCRTTYRAQARTSADRSARNPAALPGSRFSPAGGTPTGRPNLRSAVTPAARARGPGAPSSASSTSSASSSVTAARAASAHRVWTTASSSRAAARASSAQERNPSSTARPYAKRRTGRSAEVRSGVRGSPSACRSTSPSRPRAKSPR